MKAEQGPSSLDATYSRLQRNFRVVADHVERMEQETTKLREMLRVQEDRLHAIEKAVDGWSVLDDSTLTDTDLRARYEDILEQVQQACPWDDDNEHGSWYFHPSKPESSSQSS